MKKTGNTKNSIVSAAWELFYRQGYENTTIDDIVEASNTSKGSFYHYFSGKEGLLNTLSILFDEKYTELEPLLTEDQGPVEKLLFLNHELFYMIENTVSLDLLGRLLSSQLVSKSDRSLLDTNRTYYKLLRKIAIEGKDKGVFRDELSANDIIKAYAVLERALLYDWCICSGDYSLCSYAGQVMPTLLQGFCK